MQGIIFLSFQHEDRIHVVSKDWTLWNFWKYITVGFCLKMKNFYLHRGIHKEEDYRTEELVKTQPINQAFWVQSRD